MPAPEAFSTSSANSRPVLGHVNLMVDTFIANASADDLRAVVRGLLASGTPGLAASFTSAARHRLHHTASKSGANPRRFFVVSAQDPEATPTAVSTPHLHASLAQARSYYGVGMGFSSLPIFTDIILSTLKLQWEDDSEMADALSTVDSDITQAIQSAKEEIDAGRVMDWTTAHPVVDDLRRAIHDCHREVKSWGGDLPFVRAASSIQYWKL